MSIAILVGVAAAACGSSSADGSGASSAPGGLGEIGAATSGEIAESCAPSGTDRLGGDFSFTDQDGGATIRYSISLPADYHTSCTRYPVMYVLHGGSADNASFLSHAEKAREAVAAGALPDVIIVTPNGINDEPRWEGQAEVDFIDALIPYVERTYRVLPGPSHRLLSGFSMGGHGAFHYAVKYPDLFAAVWSVDGSMSSDEVAGYLQYLDQVRADQPRIATVAGVNATRVGFAVDAFAAEGVEIPFTVVEVTHDYRLFLDADARAGYPAMRFLAESLGRPM